MKNLTHVLTVVLIIILPRPSSAEGLLYQLPEDGTWAQFDVKGEEIDEDGTKVPLTGTLTLSSVGVVEVNGRPCRWIEISMDGQRGDAVFTTVHKLLIPEHRLARGQDPLKHLVKAWHHYSSIPGGPREVNVSSTSRVRELTLLVGPFLHGPYDMLERLERTPVESKLGKTDCAGVKGTDRLSLHDTTWEFTYTIRLHDKSPFGVVAWQAQIASKRGDEEAGATRTLRLTDFGTDASSIFPDAK